MLEQVEDLSGQPLEVFVVLEDLQHAKLGDLLCEAFSRLDQDICLHAGVHVVLDVDAVLARDLHEHSDVVLVVRVLLLIRMEQVLIFLQVTNDFPVDPLILQ